MAIYCFDLQFNDTYAFREYPPLGLSQRLHQHILPDMSGQTRPGIKRCPACGELLDKWNEPLDRVRVRKRKYDIGITYDGVRIVSKRFKSAYENAHLFGLTFRQLPDDPDFYAIDADRRVPFDPVRSKTQFDEQCARCGRFESVVTPWRYLQAGTVINDLEFVRTDLEFASGDEKKPMVFCGEGAAKALSEAKLKGVDLFPVEE